MWYKDTTTNPEEENVGWNIRKNYINDNSDPTGTFSFRVPLKHMFGFCEDYNKILYRMKQTLTLTRNDDNDAIFRANAVDAGKITLDKISWYMPHVMPADRERMEMYKIIQKKEKLPVGYRMIQCDSVSVDPATTFTWKLGVKSSPKVPYFIIVGFQTNKSSDQR